MTQGGPDPLPPRELIRHARPEIINPCFELLDALLQRRDIFMRERDIVVYLVMMTSRL
jgi:hypothetical protein